MKGEINSHILNYTIQGEGQAVLLLHGFMETLHIWDEIAQVLSQNYKVITIDLPGHGLSDDLKSDISIDHMASLIKELINKLEIEKASIIGHSMGGYVGLAFADIYPARIESLCLFHSMAGSDSDEAKEVRDRKIKLMLKHPHALIEESIKNLFWEEKRVELAKEIEQLSNKAKERSPSGYIQALEAMKKRPNRSNVLKTDIPIYYLAGKHDPIIPLEKSLFESKNINLGRFKILNNSGHMGFLEEKELSLELLTKFLERNFKRH